MKSKYYITFFAAIVPLLVFAQNVGIGTTTPTASLHVKTTNEYNMKLEDNSNAYASNYYITSDANGNFQKTKNDYFRGTQLTTLPNIGVSIGDTPSSTWTATEAKITLPSGKWAIIGTFLMKCTPAGGFITNNDTQLRVFGTVNSDTSNPTTPSTDILKNDGATSGGTAVFEGFINSPVPFGLMNGTILVNNNTPIPKVYTILIRVAAKTGTPTCNITNFGLASDPESMLFAIPN